MKLRSGRALRVPVLPPEILMIIVESLPFEPCTLRRHIADELSKQKLTQDSGWRDHAIRKAATAFMNRGEKETYRKIHQEFVNLALVSKEFRSLALTAERKWLDCKPMDITSFRAFCADPSALVNASKKDIALEIWPKADFCDPPSFINEEISHSAKQLTVKDRALLQWRFIGEQVQQYPGTIGTVLRPPGEGARLRWIDLIIFRALSGLWISELRKMPRHVKRVRVIARLPPKPARIVFNVSEREVYSESLTPEFWQAVAGGRGMDGRWTPASTPTGALWSGV